MPRARGSKNRQTVERETAKKIAAARAELVKNAPPLDFSMPLDSLGMMEHVVRRFYFRAKIAERLGDRVERRRANAAFMQAVRAAEKVARYRQAQLSAIKLAGDINAKVTDSASLDELIAKLKGELRRLLTSRRCARTAGVENRGRLDRDRAGGAFWGLNPADCPLSGLCCACGGRWCVSARRAPLP
jgi:hypothetical protein